MILDFQQKSNIFNDYFANQCKLNYTNSTLPPITMKTEAILSTIRPTKQKISEIIRGLNSNKAHGHDGISVTMLKISALSVVKPLN